MANAGYPASSAESGLTAIWTDRLAGADAAAYDRFVETAAGGHYSQARNWTPAAVSNGRRSARFFLAREGERVLGAAVVTRPLALGVVPAPLATVERGPVCADPSDLEPVLDALVREARRHGIARLTVMPYWAGDDVPRAEAVLARAGFRKVQTVDGAHACTLRLDIRGDLDQTVLGGKDRKKLRYELRHAERSGVTVGVSTDFALLERLNGGLMASQGLSDHPPAWYAAVANLLSNDPTRGVLVVAEHEGEAIGTVLVLRHGALAIFVSGASIPEPRPFSKMALPLLAAIRWARDAGCTTFDLGGVPMEGDTDEKRLKIAQFKYDFAKASVPLVGAHAWGL